MFYLLGKLLGKILQRAFIGLFVLLLSLGTALDGNGIRYPSEAQFTRRIREQTGLVLPQGELLESIDTHGGFHGDGEYYAAYRISDAAFVATLSQAAGWQPLPLPEELEILIYGKSKAGSASGPYLKKASVPRITDGYWYFSDRFDPSAPQRSRPVLTRGAFNFSIVIYDAESGILYYAELDT